MDASVPYPLFYRDEKACIHYPPVLEGWYWAPEVANIAGWPECEILDGWVYEDDGSYPFAWVADIYRTRQEWKEIGNPAEKALKLLLNSLYGKMAQRVGWNEKNRTAPKYHQIEWAGWVTSFTRAKLYRAMLEAGQDLVAVETDAVFSTRKLAVDVGTELGDWEETQYDELIYLQSGFRFMRQGDEWKEKFRGFDKGSIHLDDVIAYLRDIDFTDSRVPPAFVGETTRFIGMGAAFMSKNAERWRVWETTSRELRLGSDGKRVHISAFCTACQNGISPYDGFHQLAVGQPWGGVSRPHELPWKNELTPWARKWDEIRTLDLES